MDREPIPGRELLPKITFFFIPERILNMVNIYQTSALHSSCELSSSPLKSQTSTHFLAQFSSVQSLSCVQLFVTLWTAACQTSLSITNSQSLLKLMSIELVMPSNYLILCHPLLFVPSIFPSISVFSKESVLRIRWPKYSCFLSASVLPMNIQD